LPGITPLTRGKIVKLGLASVFIILVAFAAVKLFSDKENPPAIPAVISSPTPSNPLPTSLPTQITTSAPSITPSTSTEDAPISSLEPPLPVDVVPNSVPTEIATIPPTQTTQETPSINSNVYACVYVVPDDGNISTIFGYYGIDNYLVYVTEREEDKAKVLGRSKKWGDLGRYDICYLTERLCSDQVDIEETTDYMVKPGQYVIIPEVDEETCKNPKEGTGYWISVINVD